MLRQAEAEARAKTVAEARARAEAAAEGMLRAAARVRAAAEESAAREEETERLAEEARAEAEEEAAEAAARLEAAAQRVEEPQRAAAAAERGGAALEAEQARAERLAEEEAAAARAEAEAVARAVRVAAEVEAAAAARAEAAEEETAARVEAAEVAEVEAEAEAAAAEARAEARAELLTRKFAHEAAMAADEALGLTRRYATSEQRMWLERALRACRSEEQSEEVPCPRSPDSGATDTDATDDTEAEDSWAASPAPTPDTEECLAGSFERRRPQLSLAAAEAEGAPLPSAGAVSCGRGGSASKVEPSAKPHGSLAGLRRSLSAGSLSRLAFAPARRRRIWSKPAYVYAERGQAAGSYRKGCHSRMHARAVESGGKNAAAAVAGSAATPAVTRWASAPELHEIAGEIIGTREQVLAQG